MPELPEVEVVRRGIQRHFIGSDIADVQVLAERSVRDHDAGSDEFRQLLLGRTLASVERRGKFMWLRLGDSDSALVIHLGMSGQVLAQTSLADLPVHARVVLRLRARVASNSRPRTSTPPHLVFVDQRMFGRMFVDGLTDTPQRTLPVSALHIAADPLEPAFDCAEVVRRIRARTAGIKSVLLNQQVVSGIGNIYADEALWRARVHWANPACEVSPAKVEKTLEAAATVMAEALKAGGTSFDSMYVNVNGSSGYFSRELNAYGREGEPCRRCESLIVREKFENRSAFRCPRCQRRGR